MTTEKKHPYAPADRFDGGSLDCGSGLLLLIRKHIDPLSPGQLLEIVSSELSVCDDLPSWCRMTGNDFVSQVELGERVSFLVSKGHFEAASAASSSEIQVFTSIKDQAPVTQPVVQVVIPTHLPAPAPAPAIAPLSVMGIGSWPRPRWMLRALHDHLEGRLPEDEFQETADDAVRLCVEAQHRAGADVVTDGEQRRDNYSSFVGGLLDNCQLIPITDLLPYVDDPVEFETELRALDVPAGKVRHPAVFGPIGRRLPLAVHELQRVRRFTDKPVKVALPGPYLLTRTMWMECISDRAYDTREQLAVDIVRVLREEIHYLLAEGAALVQLDEPVLSEVAYGAPSGGRTFMCGALGAKRGVDEELAFALSLLEQVFAGLPRDRMAMHVCRGNWTPDEGAALTGDYTPLLPVLTKVPVGTLFLELATERAGDAAVLRALPSDVRVGVGVVNQKRQVVETPEEIVQDAERAIEVFGPERVLLNPDCGFATFADNPIVAATLAEAKLAAIVAASRILKERYGV